jgi:mevalonate pyrophosphate decarboxylase
MEEDIKILESLIKKFNDTLLNTRIFLLTNQTNNCMDIIRNLKETYEIKLYFENELKNLKEKGSK